MVRIPGGTNMAVFKEDIKYEYLTVSDMYVIVYHAHNDTIPEIDGEQWVYYPVGTVLCRWEGSVITGQIYL